MYSISYSISFCSRCFISLKDMYLNCAFIPTLLNKNKFQLPVVTKSQTHDTDVGAKGKEVYSGAAQPGRIVDSYLKDLLNLLLKPVFPIGMGRGGLFF